MLIECFGALAVGCRHFDWLDNLREHVAEWTSTMEECKRELSCVCQKMAQAVGWQLGRPCRPHAPKPSKQRQKAMRTGKAGPRLFYIKR